MAKHPGDLILKDPQSVEPHGFDWTRWLSEIGTGVTIVTSIWTVSPSGLTFSAESIVTGGLKTQMRYAGGAPGDRYTVTNHIIASTGDEEDRSFHVLVQEQ